jgi:hypothetical protein
VRIVIAADKHTIFENKAFLEKLEADTNYEVIYAGEETAPKRNLFSRVKELQPDVLITVDLLGFEQSTLTDNISYNLLDCKQIHLLLNEKNNKEHFLNKQLSISMFFYCLGDTYYDYLSTAYPNLPYLKKIPDWNRNQGENAISDNGSVLCDIITEVVTECHLI